MGATKLKDVYLKERDPNESETRVGSEKASPEVLALLS
jgi:hypothetical protein